MNTAFQNELSSIIHKYPNLSIHTKDGLGYLKGIVNIIDGNGTIFGHFLIEIHESKDYPKRYPKLYEVGGEIPCLADWHKYDNGQCCLCVEQEEIISCYKGINLVYFIEKVAMPYFANQLFRKSEGQYLNEYSHGLKGFFEFYTELFKTNEIAKWEQFCDLCFSKPSPGRNEPCYCGSGMKFKKCHSGVEEKLRVLGKEKVLYDIKILKE